MGRPVKTAKYISATDSTIDYGYPNDGTTDNGYNDNNIGIVIGDPEDRWQMVRSYACIKVNGLGTITTDSTSTTVTGTGTNFSGLQLGGDNIYTSAGVLIGRVDTVNSDGELILQANAAVTVTDSAFYYGSLDSEGILLRQKGKRKFLVARRDSIQDEYIVAGNSYYIYNVGDTDWKALGAGDNAGYGKIFTALANGTGLGTTGAVYHIGVCTLVDTIDEEDLEPGQMFVTYYDPVLDDTLPASEIFNHWLRPWDNIEDGTKHTVAIDDYSDTPDPATGYYQVRVNNWD
jgi:hypothetical protein